jgi:hypothetical protein
MMSLSEKLEKAVDRRRELRARGGHFDERARLQSEIHDLRAALARRVYRLPPV